MNTARLRHRKPAITRLASTSTRVHRVLYNTFQTPLVRETEEEIERKSVTGISGLANFRTRLLRHLHVG